VTKTARADGVMFVIHVMPQPMRIILRLINLYVNISFKLAIPASAVGLRGLDATPVTWCHEANQSMYEPDEETM
jgi:hypothetical protein